MTRVRRKNIVSPEPKSLEGKEEAARTAAEAREYLNAEPMRLVGKLTRQQKAVLLLIARDFQQDEIALAMGLSVNTVKCHRNDLYRALGVTTAVGATVIAYRAGLVS